MPPISALKTAPDAASAALPARSSSATQALARHWPEYLMEAAGLGTFMVSACLFGALYEHPGSWVRMAIDSPFLRRLLMGLSMGLTAIAIIYSPWGKQSGAHINPSVTLTFFRLGKIKGWDALFYVLAQFAGAAAGVALVAGVLGEWVSNPAVRYVVTVPAEYGWRVALLSEFVISFGLMSAVLYFSNHHALSRYTGLFAGALVAAYITLEAPFSGMSMNPARTFGSAWPAGVWDGFLVYLTAPPLGMLAAAELYLWWQGRYAVRCCKLHHDNDKRCIFCGADTPQRAKTGRGGNGGAQ